MPVLVKTTKLPVRYSYLVVFLLVVNEHGQVPVLVRDKYGQVPVLVPDKYGHCPYLSRTDTGTARAPSVPEATLVRCSYPCVALRLRENTRAVAVAQFAGKPTDRRLSTEESIVFESQHARFFFHRSDIQVSVRL